MRSFAVSLLAATTVVVGSSHAQIPNWAEVTTANAPGGRQNHAMAYDSARGKIVMFGGWFGQVNPTDTWEYDGVNWTQVMTASSPPARFDHAMAYDSARGKVVMFGGFMFDDTWEFDGVDWTQVTTAIDPGYRLRHAMAYDSARGKIVMFGGEFIMGSFRNDTWEYDGVNWTHVTTANVMVPRGRHSMAYDSARGKVVMFGGTSVIPGTNNFLYPTDTWEYDGVDWTQVTTASGLNGRNWHTMVYDSARGKIVLFGGAEPLSGIGWANDTWEYDGLNWAEVTTANAPGARNGNTGAYDSARGKVVMYGGTDLSGAAAGYLTDTWEYDLSYSASTLAFGSGCPAAQPLALNSNLPLLGTTWQLTASSVDPASPLCLFWFGETAVNPGVDLSFIGAVGCFAYTNANLGAFFAPVTSGVSTFAVSVPNDPVLLAYALTVQASASSNSTAVGLVTSNGLTGVIGNQ
jgi:hypothetical protein